MNRFEIDVPEPILADLRERLRRTRWPEQVAAPPWSEGTDRDALRDLLAYWADGFDWRAQETTLNALAHFRADVDGRGVHFVHVRGRGPDRVPLILTHGWPSTFFEFWKLIPLLTERFDVVVPSLPGYGFSDKPTAPGQTREIPRLWVRLMRDVLGYERFLAHGGDVGAWVTNRLALEHPEVLLGIHVTLGAEPDPGAGPPLTAEERAYLRRSAVERELGSAYAHVHRTAPQTLAYGLSDSPAALAAWILEKWHGWSDGFARDELLTTLTLYWATGTAGSALRVYRDWALGAIASPAARQAYPWAPPGADARPLDHRIEVPAAVACFDSRPPRSWVERAYGQLRRFTVMPAGGHFAALEQPGLLAADLCAFAELVRA